MTEAQAHDQRKHTGDIIGGHYRVLSVLGEGGMGVVYKVEDLRLDGRLRALKMILPERVSDHEAMRRFRKEVKALTTLRNDHIVDIVDVHVDDGVAEPFFVTEFLEGRTLDDLLREKGPLDRTSVVVLLHQVALALEAMHAKGIAHRDLKPANLFLSKRYDNSLSVKVVDFGIAKFITPERATTFIAGSSGYMAPEQAAGYGVDHRADIFAFGRLAAEMLLGEVSSAAAHEQTISTPQAFVEWMTKATALNPNERFQSALEAVQRLADALEVPLRLSSTTWSVPSTHSGGFGPPAATQSRRFGAWAWLGVVLLLTAAVAAALSRPGTSERNDDEVAASAAPPSVPEPTSHDERPGPKAAVSVTVASASEVPAVPTPVAIPPADPPKSRPIAGASRPRPASSSTGHADPPSAASAPVAPAPSVRDPAKPKRPVF